MRDVLLNYVFVKHFIKPMEVYYGNFLFFIDSMEIPGDLRQAKWVSLRKFIVRHYVGLVTSRIGSR